MDGFITYLNGNNSVNLKAIRQIEISYKAACGVHSKFDYAFQESRSKELSCLLIYVHIQIIYFLFFWGLQPKKTCRTKFPISASIISFTSMCISLSDQPFFAFSKIKFFSNQIAMRKWKSIKFWMTNRQKTNWWGQAHKNIWRFYRWQSWTSFQCSRLLLLWGWLVKRDSMSMSGKINKVKHLKQEKLRWIHQKGTFFVPQ